MPHAKELPADPNSIEGRLLFAVGQLHSVLKEVEDGVKGLSVEYRDWFNPSIQQVVLPGHIYETVRDHVRVHCTAPGTDDFSYEFYWQGIQFAKQKEPVEENRGVQAIKFVSDLDAGLVLDESTEVGGFWGRRLILARVRSPFRNGWFLRLESYYMADDREEMARPEPFYIQPWDTAARGHRPGDTIPVVIGRGGSGSRSAPNAPAQAGAVQWAPTHPTPEVQAAERALTATMARAIDNLQTRRAPIPRPRTSLADMATAMMDDEIIYVGPLDATATNGAGPTQPDDAL